jgi:hypothetical protein
MAPPKKSAKSSKLPAQSARARKKPPKKWSHVVSEHSDALDLERSIFKSTSPRRIARSLKRGGANLTKSRKEVLEQAKPALRRAFGRDA